MKAETYWERRALISENVTRELMLLISQHFPGTQDHIERLAEARDRAVDKLNAEFNESDNTH